MAMIWNTIAQPYWAAPAWYLRLWKQWTKQWMSQHIVVTCDITIISLLTLHTPLLWSPSRDLLGRTANLIQRDSPSTSGGFETNALVTGIQGGKREVNCSSVLHACQIESSRECVLCCRVEEGAAEAPHWIISSIYHHCQSFSCSLFTVR